MPVPELSYTMQKHLQKIQQPSHMQTKTQLDQPPMKTHSAISTIPQAPLLPTTTTSTAFLETTSATLTTQLSAITTSVTSSSFSHTNIGGNSRITSFPSSMTQPQQQMLSSSSAKTEQPLKSPPLIQTPSSPSHSLQAAAKQILLSPQYKDRLPNSQIDEIQKSFLMQQHAAAREKQRLSQSNESDRDLKPSASTTPVGVIKQRDNVSSVDTSNNDEQRQMFFPDRIPVHPSQLLRQKWQSPTTSSTSLSPHTPKSPLEVLTSSKPSSASIHGSFTSPTLTNSYSQEQHHSISGSFAKEQPSNVQPLSQQQRQEHVSQTMNAPAISKASQYHQQHSTPPPHSPFSVRTILASSNKTATVKQEVGATPASGPAAATHHTDNIALKNPVTNNSEHAASKIRSPTQHHKEMELKKSLLKAKKREEKEKILIERRRQRELEKQKKRDEKAQLKLIRDKKKEERIQQKIMKQKVLQAKASVLKLSRKKKVVPTIVNKVVPKERNLVASPVSPVPKPPPVTPKIPLCEPDAHLVYSLVQPLGHTNMMQKPVVLSGTFGSASFEGIEDTYSDKPVPEPLDINLQTSGVLLNGNALFASPERCGGIEYGDPDMGKISSNDENYIDTDTTDPMKQDPDFAGDFELDHDMKDIEPDEFDQIALCNNCYQRLNQTVYYVDKKLEEVSEGIFDRNDCVLTDQLAFCSNDCVEIYQQKIDHDLDNEDFELVDAVKTAAMVTLDKNFVFPPFPDETRGDSIAPGMDGAKPEKTKEVVNERWKRWNFPFVTTKKQRPRLERQDLYELMNKYDVRLKPPDGIKDKRVCMLCKAVGDGETAQASRLLNFDVDEWVHLNCALWSSEVYEALNGGLHNVNKAFERSKTSECCQCGKMGATVNCSYTFGVQQRQHCEKTYHFCCAVQAQSSFYKDKVKNKFG